MSGQYPPSFQSGGSVTNDVVYMSVKWTGTIRSPRSDTVFVSGSDGGSGNCEPGTDDVLIAAFDSHTGSFVLYCLRIGRTKWCD